MERDNDLFYSIQERYPIAYYTLYFLVGSLLGSAFKINLSALFFLIFFFTLITLAQYLFTSIVFEKGLVFSYKLSFLLLGIFGITLNSSKFNNQNQLKLKENITICIPIKEKPIKKGEFFSTTTKLKKSAKWLYIKSKENTFYTNISIGDTLIIDVANSRINWDKYGNYKLTLYEDDFKIVKCKHNDVLISILKFRENISKKATKKLKSENNRGIFNALILGNKSGIKKKTKDNFITAGTMHMLAISGMHTGYIYAILLAALSFLGKSIVSNYIKSFLIIIFIWFYAILTGFADSVIRSAFMITIQQTAFILERGKLSLNSIGISGMIMIILNPAAIFDLGFQLSFMATLSIVMIFPLLKNLIKTKNRLINYIWQIITMSISGQAGTFLITIFSFGRFPVYFILGNFLSAPIVVLCMFLSLIGIFLLPFDIISDNIFKILEFSISIFGFIAQSIANMPFSSIII